MINLSKTRIRRYKNIPVGTTKAPEMAVSGAFFRLVILLAIVKLPVMAAPANVIADTSLDVSWLTSGETNENIDKSTEIIKKIMEIGLNIHNNILNL